ncbi:F-box [Glarea lozoyensis ATCC 20868]|uniref:F-box n=1 Tax=Glarea lozoyensis (strain ATCC 20868 / MF5171) TaxID=1116229 RepID=S3CPT6_GLAL2|nr:F-box [Glarea lozoyensis ATCC 20868]EPE27149.1 F-box [Glarea lozoyensis ATCC 20868]
MDVTKALDSLRLEDGMPDVVARREALERLLNSINRNEIRFLQERLLDFKFTKDFVSLPTELLIHIVDYLELEDFMRIRAVSHRWNDTFSTAEICSIFTKNFFRPYWNAFEYDSQILADWLPRAVLKRLQRTNGHHCSVLHGERKTGPSLLAVYDSSRTEYCSGRIAYNYDAQTVAVKNLRTGIEIHLREDNREPMNEWKLFDQFLIVKIASWGPRRLLAIPLERDSTMQTSTIQLPSFTSNSRGSITASGKQVGIITQPGEVFLWNIGGCLSQLKFSPACAKLEKASPVDSRLYFNPYDESRCYLVMIATTHNHSAKTREFQVILQEYESGKATTAHQFVVSVDYTIGGLGVELVELEDGCIGLKIPGDNTTLLADIDPITESISPLGQQARRKCSPCTHTFAPPELRINGVAGSPNPQTIQPFVILKFDIHSRRWSTATFHLLGYHFSRRKHTIWRDQYLYDHEFLDRESDTYRTENIYCVKNCSLPSTKRVPWVETEPGIRITEVNVDDEFLVCFHGDGYTALQYPTVDPLPKKTFVRDW